MPSSTLTLPIGLRRFSRGSRPNRLPSNWLCPLLHPTSIWFRCASSSRCAGPPNPTLMPFAEYSPPHRLRHHSRKLPSKSLFHHLQLIFVTERTGYSHRRTVDYAASPHTMFEFVPSQRNLVDLRLVIAKASNCCDIYVAGVEAKKRCQGGCQLRITPFVGANFARSSLECRSETDAKILQHHCQRGTADDVRGARSRDCRRRQRADRLCYKALQFRPRRASA